MHNSIADKLYDPGTIEKKWLRKWEEDRINILKDFSKKEKYYCLEMFPYPSGEPHMGHARNYTIGDVLARIKSRQGFNVLHPMGYDAFGLPAENAAIKSGIHPKKSTFINIHKMEEALKKMGMTYNFKEQIITCEPEYYKWTQWLFLLLFKMGLALKKEGPVNWCNSCQTVLANEQVIEGRCERCESEVIKKNLSQWYFKITNYAQALLDDMKLLNGWPEKVLTIQKNWIGRSEGAQINFRLDDNNENISIPVFTTRPDTVFGVTFFILSPEHPLVEKIVTDEKYKKEIARLKEIISRQTDIERGSALTEKIGGFTGRYVINPVSGEKIPVWIANYVLSDYGTGAIMAVPAHDERDFEFAKKYNIPIREVISATGKAARVLKEVFTGQGKMINSGQFNGLDSEEGKRQIIKFITDNNVGSSQINYKLKDWLISRQRYWGAPIPVIFCKKCGMVPVPEEDLPVILPEDVDFKPTGLSPLSYSSEFVNTNCPVCGGPAKRETDTMDTFVCSSWYFLRYCSPLDKKEAFNTEEIKYWMPVDQYIGGIEHATMHLIYSRFFTKVLYDAGLVKFREPFTRYYPHGVVTLGGHKMSKSKGNIINPSEIYNKYGSDTLRLYILFIGPADSVVDWSSKGVEGSYRFLERFYRIMSGNIERLKKAGYLTKDRLEVQDSPKIDFNIPDELSKELARKLHQTIKKVTNDSFRFSFNTAISAIMELLNAINKYNNSIKKAGNFNAGLIFEATKNILQLISPITPFITEELWEKLGMHYSIHKTKWPDYDPGLAKEERITIVFQVNGKIREKKEFQAGCSEEEVSKIALASPRIIENIKNKTVIKKIFVKDKLYNIVTD